MGPFPQEGSPRDDYDVLFEQAAAGAAVKPETATVAAEMPQSTASARRMFLVIGPSVRSGQAEDRAAFCE